MAVNFSPPNGSTSANDVIFSPPEGSTSTTAVLFSPPDAAGDGVIFNRYPDLSEGVRVLYSPAVWPPNPTASAIEFVGVANSTSGAVEGESATVTYSPTVGNTVVVFVGVSGNPGSMVVTDSKSATLSAGASINNGTGQYLYCFYYTATSGVTSFTASWTEGLYWAFTVVEYSGVTSINAGLSGNTNTGNSALPSITNTTQDANDWLVVGLANVSLASNDITITTGNQRNSDAASEVYLAVGDNTAATAGSVTVAGSQASAAWTAVSIELRT